MDGVLAILYLVGGLFSMMLAFYLSLCFIVWVSDMIEHKSWRYWF